MERDFDERKQARKKKEKKNVPAQKKNRESSLSLSSPHSLKNTYILINMSGARLIVFYFATFSLSLSLSLQGRERFFVRFCPKSSCAHRFARTKNGFLLFSFLFSRVRVLCVCVGGSFISFFVCLPLPRARAFRSCFLTTTTRA